jgi:hypothetical protein
MEEIPTDNLVFSCDLHSEKSESVVGVTCIPLVESLGNGRQDPPHSRRSAASEGGLVFAFFPRFP